MGVTGISVLMILLAPAAAIAAPVVEKSTHLSQPAGVPSVLGFGASLLFVIAAILFVGWLYARTQSVRSGTSKVINILATQSLGTKERIVLIGIGDKQIVVGMTATQLQTLHVFEQPVVSMAERQHGSAFAERLVAAIKGAGK